MPVGARRARVRRSRGGRRLDVGRERMAPHRPRTSSSLDLRLRLRLPRAPEAWPADRLHRRRHHVHRVTGGVPTRPCPSPAPSQPRPDLDRNVLGLDTTLTLSDGSSAIGTDTDRRPSAAARPQAAPPRDLLALVPRAAQDRATGSFAPGFPTTRSAPSNGTPAAGRRPNAGSGTTSRAGLRPEPGLILRARMTVGRRGRGVHVRAPPLASPARSAGPTGTREAGARHPQALRRRSPDLRAPGSTGRAASSRAMRVGAAASGGAGSATVAGALSPWGPSGDVLGREERQTAGPARDRAAAGRSGNVPFCRLPPAPRRGERQLSQTCQIGV